MRIPIILILLCIVALLIHDACAAGKNTTRKANRNRANKNGNSGTPSRQAAAPGKQNKNTPEARTNGQSPKKGDKSIGNQANPAEVKDVPQLSTPKKLLRAATVGVLLLSNLAGPIPAGAYDINQDRNSHMTEAEQYKMHGRANNMEAYMKQRSNLYGETAAANNIHGKNNNIHAPPKNKAVEEKTTHNYFARHTRTRNPPPPPPHKKTLRSPNFSTLAAERAKQKKEEEERMNNKVFYEETETNGLYQQEVPSMPQDKFYNNFEQNREQHQNLVPVEQYSVSPIVDKSQLGPYHNPNPTHFVPPEQIYANTLDENESQYYPNQDQLTQVDTYVHDGQNYPKITQAPPAPARTQVFNIPHQDHEPTSYNLCGPNWNKFGHHCYLVSTNPSGKPISFEEANKECQQHNPNAKLASIHSPMEEDFVAALTKNRPFRSQKQGQSLYWLAQMKSAVEHPNNDMDVNYDNEGGRNSNGPFVWSDGTNVGYGNPTDKKSGKNFPWYTKPSTKYLEKHPVVVMYGKKKDGENNPWMDEKHTGTWSAISTQSATHGESVPDVHGYVCKMPTMKATNTHHLNPRAPPNADEQQQFSTKMAQNFNSPNPTENIDEKDEEPHFSRNNGNQYGLGSDDEHRRRWP